LDNLFDEFSLQAMKEIAAAHPLSKLRGYCNEIIATEGQHVIRPQIDLTETQNSVTNHPGNDCNNTAN
jgi:hypothetical protein